MAALVTRRPEGLCRLYSQRHSARCNKMATLERRAVADVSHVCLLTRWLLPRLSAQPAGEGIEVSPRHLGTLLAEARQSFQRSRTWKASPDPGYEQKAARILDLCERPPADGPVVSFDQMGPVSLRSIPGAGWDAQATARAAAGRLQPPRRRPLRVRRLRRTRRPAPRPASSQTSRKRHARRSGSPTPPANGSTGSRTTFRPTGCPQSEPTRRQPHRARTDPNVPQLLKLVDCHFSALTEFAVANADYLDWDAFGYALARYVRSATATTASSESLPPKQNTCGGRLFRFADSWLDREIGSSRLSLPTAVGARTRRREAARA
jgi:hypothetical protein